MASKFRESPRPRRRGLQTPPHVHLGESGQSGLERETELFAWSSASLRMELDAPPPGLKPRIYIPERSRGFENPLPRTKVRGWHSLSCSLIQIQQNVFRRPISSSRNVETRDPGLASWAKFSRPSGTEFGALQQLVGEVLFHTRDSFHMPSPGAKVMVPKQISETRRPVGPSVWYFIGTFADLGLGRAIISMWLRAHLVQKSRSS